MALHSETEPNAFDPAAWLASFTAIGGGYALIAGRRVAFIIDPANTEAANVVSEATGFAGRLDAVREMIERRQNREAE